jgi:prephenate dehydratase
MFITLTNAAPIHRTKPIALNADIVVSVHHNIAVREDGTIDEVTFVHCPPHGTWEVMESMEEVVELLNKSSKID